MTVDGTGAVAVATGLSGGELMIELPATLERLQTTATFDVPQQTVTHDHQHADQHAQHQHRTKMRLEDRQKASITLCDSTVARHAIYCRKYAIIRDKNLATNRAKTQFITRFSMALLLQTLPVNQFDIIKACMAKSHSNQSNHRIR